MNIKLFLFFILAIIGLESNGQNNVHFSQFYNTPLTLNPALTGRFEDSYRLAGIYRRQWSGLTENGSARDFVMETPSGSLDFNINNNIGLGVLFLNDQTGSAIFNQITIGLSFAKHFDIKDDVLSFGFQGIYNATQLDLGKLRFINIEPSLLDKPASYFDIHAGVNYTKDFKTMVADVGYSLNHTLRPNQTFLANSAPNPIPFYHKAYVRLNWELLDKITLYPAFYFAYQGSSTNILYGSNVGFKYLESVLGKNRLIGGLWARSNRGNIEAIIPKIGTSVGKLQFMFSYDHHLSLRNASIDDYKIEGPPYNINTFEFSVIYTGKPKKVPPLLEDNFILNPRY